MKYAILNEKNKCIAVTNFTTSESSDIPIPDNDNSSDYLGKIYNHDTEKWEEDLPLERIEEQVYNNNENNIILMEAMADQYEQTEQYRINDMEVQATIFETVLALSGGGTAV